MRRVCAFTFLGFGGLYLLVCLVMYLAQERLLFPTWAVGPAAALPRGTERLAIDTPDGVRLSGVHLPPVHGTGSGTVILAFAGNATNAEFFAAILQRELPEHEIVAFHYRGYSPSGGTPGAVGMIEDAPLIHDLVQQRYRPRYIVAVGMSLGSGIAATLAARRPLTGAVLITPFDSLREVAAQLYWWLPVRLLMRHDVDSVEALQGGDVPVAIIAAGEDRLVRPERTARLREFVRQLRFDATLAGADHNDIIVHPQFDDALRNAVAQVGG